MSTSHSPSPTTSAAAASKSANNHNNHSLYHEAVRRASRPQPVVKHTQPKSLLLSAPNNIIFELFDTILKRMPTDSLLSFIKSGLKDYLRQNWSNKITQRAIGRLRREQAVDIRAGLTSKPDLKYLLSNKKIIKSNNSTSSKKSSKSNRHNELKQSLHISPTLDYHQSEELDTATTTTTTTSKELTHAIDQIYEHIMWRIDSDNVTQIASLLVKLALDDGYKRRKIRVELYDDVVSFFETARSILLIKLYSFGDAPANDQKLLLSNTTKGDVTKWIANYIDGSEKKQNPNLLKTFVGALRDKTKNCFYITNDLTDAIASLKTNSIRCAIVIDRNNMYDITKNLLQEFSTLESLIVSGKLYLLASLDCIEFAPDPTSATCC